MLWDIFFKDSKRFPLYKRWRAFINERKDNDEKAKKMDYKNDVGKDNYSMLFEFFEDVSKGRKG